MVTIRFRLCCGGWTIRPPLSYIGTRGLTKVNVCGGCFDLVGKFRDERVPQCNQFRGRRILRRFQANSCMHQDQFRLGIDEYCLPVYAEQRELTAWAEQKPSLIAVAVKFRHAARSQKIRLRGGHIQ